MPLAIPQAKARAVPHLGVHPPRHVAGEEQQQDEGQRQGVVHIDTNAAGQPPVMSPATDLRAPICGTSEQFEVRTGGSRHR